MKADLLKRLKQLEDRIHQDELDEAERVDIIEVVLSDAVKPRLNSMGPGAVAGAAKGTTPEKKKRASGAGESVIPKAAGRDISDEQPAQEETPNPSAGKVEHRNRRTANSYFRGRIRKAMRRPSDRP